MDHAYISLQFVSNGTQTSSSPPVKPVIVRLFFERMNNTESILRCIVYVLYSIPCGLRIVSHFILVLFTPCMSAVLTISYINAHRHYTQYRCRAVNCKFQSHCERADPACWDCGVNVKAVNFSIDLSTGGQSIDAGGCGTMDDVTCAPADSARQTSSLPPAPFCYCMHAAT